MSNFTGFSQESIKFLQQLALNNNKPWFDENRHTYENYLLKDAFAFTNALGEALSKHVPNLVFIPKVGGSMFRLNRDVRFAKDKAPYKTNIGLILWKGPFAQRYRNPCFYFELSGSSMFTATGLWYFEKDYMDEYRRTLKHDDKIIVIATELAREEIPLGGEQLKKYPNGFTADDKCADFAKYKGLYAHRDETLGLPDIVHTGDLIDYCLSFYTKTVPLLNWMVDVAIRAYKTEK